MRMSRREYRQKAFDCLSRAKDMKNPEDRAEMIQFAQMWLSLSEPVADIPGAYEFFTKQ